MKKAEAIKYFGSVKKLAEALEGITTQAVYGWGDSIPKSRQYQIEIITKGKLKADKS